MWREQPVGVWPPATGCKRQRQFIGRKEVRRTEPKDWYRNHHRIFTIYADVVAAFVSNADSDNTQQALGTSALHYGFLRGSAGAFFFSSGPMPIFSEMAGSIVCGQGIFDRNVDVTRIARLIDIRRNFMPAVVEVPSFAFSKTVAMSAASHRPTRSVVNPIVAIEMSKVGKQRGAWINWQKTFSRSDSIGHAIVRQDPRRADCAEQDQRWQMRTGADKEHQSLPASHRSFFVRFPVGIFFEVSLKSAAKYRDFFIPTQFCNIWEGASPKSPGTGFRRSGRTLRGYIECRA